MKYLFVYIIQKLPDILLAPEIKEPEFLEQKVQKVWQLLQDGVVAKKAHAEKVAKKMNPNKFEIEVDQIDKCYKNKICAKMWSNLCEFFKTILCYKINQ